MPQMSPLLWIVLFTSFSILILFSLLKTYFNITSMKKESKEILSNQVKIIKIKWSW